MVQGKFLSYLLKFNKATDFVSSSKITTLSAYLWNQIFQSSSLLMHYSSVLNLQSCHYTNKSMDQHIC